MLSSIQPLGERSRGNRFTTTATAFFLGATAGGATTGLVLWVIGLGGRALVHLVSGPRLSGPTPAEPIFVAILGIVGVIALTADWIGRPLPSLPRQVNEAWLTTYRGWVYGVGFGFQLGLGVVTFITAPATWMWLAALALSPSWSSAVLIGAVFGGIRGISVYTTYGVSHPAALTHYHQVLNTHFSRFNTASRVVLALVSIGALLSTPMATSFTAV